jgi:hypothetical protein
LPVWEDTNADSTFTKARRKDAYRRLARQLTRRDPSDLLPLDEVTRRLRFFEQHYVGIRSIPVNRIVGTAGRNGGFSAGFLPRRPEMRQRWRRVEQSFPGGGFPPIVVYKVGESFFVVDGHHRVAIAKQRQMDYIDAEVTELRTRYELPPDADIGKLIYLEQKRLFMEESGLDRARPEADIDFSRVDGFVELLELVKAHGFHVMLDRKKIVPMEEIAADWYDWLYLPAVEAIREQGLDEAFPEATESDLFLWIWQRRRVLFPERGGMTIEEAVRATREEHRPPERLRRMRRDR